MAAARPAPSSTAPEALLTIRCMFQWQLWLDPEQEHNPFAHFYLSTPYSTKVEEVPLETASGTTKLLLKFGTVNNGSSSSVLDRITPEDLLRGCDLNIDLFIHTYNNYKERVTNPAGSLIVALHELVERFHQPDAASEPLEKPVLLFMVHEPARKVKGMLSFSALTMNGKTIQTVLPGVSLRGVPVSMRSWHAANIQAVVRRNTKMQQINSRFIEASEVLYEGVEPTIESVARINSAIWVSRAGIFPPVAYTMDICKPTIPESFYSNLLEVILARNRLTTEDLLQWKLGECGTTEASAADVEKMANVSGQLLCLYVIHCTYRSDFVYAHDSKAKKMVKVMTENFGDVTVDRGAGDCEDFGKMIIRIYRGLIRLRNVTKRLELLKLINFLRCYYPFLVLLGVSSAQINASVKDIVEMGAHENTILVPKLKFIDALARTNAEARAWRKSVLGKFVLGQGGAADDEDELWQRSKLYPDIVCEGTGILHPTMRKETTTAARKVLEHFMEEDVFYALRREYFYDHQQTGFYKTAEKIFLPEPILSDGFVGGFLVMQSRKDNPRRMPLGQKLTKSVGFTSFISGDDPNVYILMEPKLHPQEMLAIFEGMKNIHPPEPLFPPGTRELSTASQPSVRTRCERVISHIMKAPSSAALAASFPTPSMIYYLRVGKVDDPTCRAVRSFLENLPKGLLRDYQVYSEWATDSIGGYRLELYLDDAHVKRLYQKHLAEAAGSRE